MDGTINMPCKLCGYVYCKDHLSPHKHKCKMLENVEYVKPDDLSNSFALQSKNELISSTDSSNNVGSRVQNMTHDENNLYWLSDCLEDAKNLIVQYHDEKPDDSKFIDCKDFFGNKMFDIKLQNNGNASGDINLIRGLPSQPSYTICIHDVFQDGTRDNRRMVTIVTLHQLLHALHPSRLHDSINGKKGIAKLEHDLANRASYHDAVLNLESLTQSGKIHLCNM